jgi:hypothetical protein
MLNFRIVPVTAVVLCPLSINQVARAQTNPSLTDITTQSAVAKAPPTTVGVVDNVKQIQTALAKIVEAGVSKGEFDTLTSYLTKADRDRIGEARNTTWKDLDGRIDQFRKDWQAKYGQEFKVTDKPSVVFNDECCKITEAAAATAREETRGAAPASTAPSAQAPDYHAARTASETIPNARAATVAITNGGAASISPTTLSLVNEGTLVPTWRIKLPGDIDGQKLHDNLLRELTAFDEDKANWPTDVNQAYDLASRHVLAAISGTSVPTSPTTAPTAGVEPETTPTH